MAPEVGLEPTTLRLTAECSAIELLRNVFGPAGNSRAYSVITNRDRGVKGYRKWSRGRQFGYLGVEEYGDIVGGEGAVPCCRAGSDYGLVIFA